MGAINGSEVYLNISTDGGKTFALVAYADQADFNSGATFREVTTKFSSGHRILEATKKEWTLSTAGLVVYLSEGLNPVDLFDYIDTRRLIFVELSGANDAQAFYVIGKAFLTAKQVDGGAEDNQVYSVSIQGTKYAGSSWGEYTAERANNLGGIAEALACVNSQVSSLRAVTIN